MTRDVVAVESFHKEGTFHASKKEGEEQAVPVHILFRDYKHKYLFSFAYVYLMTWWYPKNILVLRPNTTKVSGDGAPAYEKTRRRLHCHRLQKVGPPRKVLNRIQEVSRLAGTA